MKKFLLSALIACFAVSVASAQEPGSWAVGPRLSFYTHTGAEGAVLGVGAIGRYSMTRHWRIEPAITALCEKGCSIDVNADLQYQFHLLPVWSLYPAVGISANDFGSWSCGINLGAGTDFSIARHWDVTAGVKWMLQTADYHKNPLIVTIGATYKF